MNEIEKIGKKLLELRVERGYSLRYVAEITKISKSSLNDYENGKTDMTISTVYSLARFYNVDVTYLLGLSEVKNGKKKKS